MNKPKPNIPNVFSTNLESYENGASKLSGGVRQGETWTLRNEPAWGLVKERGGRERSEGEEFVKEGSETEWVEGCWCQKYGDVGVKNKGMEGEK